MGTAVKPRRGACCFPSIFSMFFLCWFRTGGGGRRRLASSFLYKNVDIVVHGTWLPGINA